MNQSELKNYLEEILFDLEIIENKNIEKRLQKILDNNENIQKEFLEKLINDLQNEILKVKPKDKDEYKMTGGIISNIEEIKEKYLNDKKLFDYPNLKGGTVQFGSENRIQEFLKEIGHECNTSKTCKFNEYNFKGTGDYDWVNHNDPRSHKTKKCKDCFLKEIKNAKRKIT